MVLLGLALEHLLQLAQPVGVLVGEVAGLAPVVGVVVELPDVLVEGALRRVHHLPGDPVPGHRCPALVVDAAVADHLEVLRGVPVLGLRRVEGVAQAGALHGLLLDPAERLGA